LYDIGTERPAKRSLAEKDHAIQAFVFYRTHEPLRERITVGRSHWASNWLHALSIQMPSKTLRQPYPLFVGEPKPLSFELLLEYTVLFDEIVYDRLLVAVKPAGQGN